ncbi:unnamed protein product [Caenorhabditis angaria]|uniref:mannosyl-oligosaccharide 1,3-1,6-alpha-mannosidase n=1 Tax=Caenorhabditis angaria TaxID=860376 RepID=A0A9P1I4A3_9PELO|nr:unnamed protein product [Caenorhabditis angaria]
MIRYVRRKCFVVNKSKMLIYLCAVLVTFSIGYYHRLNLEQLNSSPGISGREKFLQTSQENEEKNLEIYNTFEIHSAISGGSKPAQPQPKSWKPPFFKTKPKLKVFVLPFSHVDPGWLETFENYTLRTNQILTNMHDFMMKKENEKMRFMWAEMVFFERWWSLQKENVKEDVRGLVKSGRLELASGSWVMTDEANAYFPVSVDNIIEGINFVHDNFHQKPTTIWSNDPFGYSNSVPYLFQKSGIKRNVINRIHHSIKKQLQSQKAIPFKWQQYFSRENGILTHVLPYTHYDILNSCGPNADKCCQFDFKRITHWNCPGPAPQNITLQNVAEKSKMLVDQLKIQSDLYRSPVILMMHGDDFRYDMIQEWHQQHDNFMPIFEHINSGNEVEIKFGTFTDYFDALEEDIHKNPENQPPVLEGDFFPYMCALGDYWTGYYTTRPFYKRQGRILHSLLRTADLLIAISTQDLNKEEIFEKMKKARRTLSLFQHHDAITGTSKVHVMTDYSKLLHENIKEVRTIISQVTENSEVLREEKNSGDIESDKIIETAKNSNFGVKDLAEYQIEPRFLENGSQDGESFLLVFTAKLEGLSWHEFEIIEETSSTKMAQVSDLKIISSNDVSLENEEIQTIHNKSSGEILEILNKKSGKTTSLKQSWMTYPRAFGGAYLMRIHQKPQTLKVLKIIVVKGPIRQSIYQIYEEPSILQRVSVNAKSSEIDLSVRVDIRKTQNTELMTRFEVDWKKVRKYTDSVGLQLIRRENYDGLNVEANYYPMPTSAVMEDGRERFTIASNLEHGARFVESGILEINIDRMLNQDDGKGLGSDSNSIPTDLKPVEMDFKILIEPKNEPKHPYYSTHSSQAQKMVQNVIYPNLIVSSDKKETSKLDGFSIELPCDLQLLTIRQLSGNRQFLTIFKFSTVSCEEDLKASLQKLFNKMGVKRVQRTDLSGVTNIGDVQDVQAFNVISIDAFDFLNLVLYF